MESGISIRQASAAVLVQALGWALVWCVYEGCLWVLTDVLHFKGVPIFVPVFFLVIIGVSTVMARPVRWYDREDWNWDAKQRLWTIVGLTLLAGVLGELIFLVTMVSMGVGRLAVADTFLVLPEILADYDLTYVLMKVVLAAGVISMGRQPIDPTLGVIASRV